MRNRKAILVLACLLGFTVAYAAPVSLEEARTLGCRFVKANFEPTRQSSELTLVYSTPSFYVFNVGNTGFVILSSDDDYRPLIGYSDERTFSPDDMAPALQAYLDGINEYRMTFGTVNTDVRKAKEDWAMLRKNGKPVSRHGGREAFYLVQTTWNQNYPYNYCCPVDENGPGGHVYAGCVATAGSQVMKYWNYPLHGQGSHTYTPMDNPQYGPITVNFGAATYDWDNMPNSISSASPIEQLEAVGQLIYHVGVSVDMNYRPSSSGASTNDMVNTMPMFFNYSDHILICKREDYTHENYMQILMESFDMAWPLVMAGTNPETNGGHAFIFDGYDDYDNIHVNWGWSGNNDGWYYIEDQTYTLHLRCFLNFVPAVVYNNTPKAPTNLSVTPAENNELSTTVTWTNPTQTLTNQPLTHIDQIVVMRGQDVVFTQDNVEPGVDMMCEDNSVPYFGSFEYKVFAVIDGQRGPSVVINGINVGPTCEWKFVASSSNVMGWRGGYIAVYNSLGNEIKQVTVTNATPTVINVDMPLGPVMFEWIPSTDPFVYTLTLNIKDAEGNSVYYYSGSCNDMEEGVFYEGNNGCGNEPTCEAPSELTAMQDPEDDHAILLQWSGVDDPNYGYLIYRDSILCRMITDGSTEFRDENVPVGGHSYQVASLCEGGVSLEASNLDCAPSGPCYPPRNLDNELTATY